MIQKNDTCKKCKLGLVETHTFAGFVDEDGKPAGAPSFHCLEKPIPMDLGVKYLVENRNTRVHLKNQVKQLTLDLLNLQGAMKQATLDRQASEAEMQRKHASDIETAFANVVKLTAESDDLRVQLSEAKSRIERLTDELHTEVAYQKFFKQRILDLVTADDEETADPPKSEEKAAAAVDVARPAASAAKATFDDEFVPTAEVGSSEDVADPIEEETDEPVDEDSESPNEIAEGDSEEEAICQICRKPAKGRFSFEEGEVPVCHPMPHVEAILKALPEEIAAAHPTAAALIATYTPY